MLSYELYWRDEDGDPHFIGVLPERRKNSERITEASVLNWGREVVGDNRDVKHIYFVKRENPGGN